MVRGITLKPTDGVVRGQAVTDTGAPISVPVGDATLGTVFDVIGTPLEQAADQLQISERWPSTARPRTSTSSESAQMFETGIRRSTCSGRSSCHAELCFSLP